MKGIHRQLAMRVSWAEKRDESRAAVPGVLAVHGPRAEGDVSTVHSPLSADLFDAFRASPVPGEVAAVAVPDVGARGTEKAN